MIYQPESRSIPLTRFDCEDYAWMMDCNGITRICKIHQPGVLFFRCPIDCKAWCEHKECPKGFAA